MMSFFLKNRESVINQVSLIESLYKNFPDLVLSLKKSQHAFDNTFDGAKKFHLEDTIWTHTMMVVQAAVSLGFDLEGIACSLVHDLGKPQSRTLNTKKESYVFYNHGEIGVQYAYDFLINYQRENNNLTDDMIKRIISVVSNHIDFFNIKLNDMCKYVNYDKNLFKLFINHSVVDNIGRVPAFEKLDSFFETYSEIEEKLNYEFESFPEPKEPFEKNIIFFCGCSNVGKDTYAKKLNKDSYTTSFDNSRIQMFLDNHTLIPSSTKELYKRAFEYACMNNGNDKLRKLFFKDINDNIENFKTINICNTFCRKKTRMSIIRELRNRYKKLNMGIHCKYLLSESSEIFKRAKFNNEKVISHDVICKFMNFQDIPTMLEGFDSLEIVLVK